MQDAQNVSRIKTLIATGIVLSSITGSLQANTDLVNAFAGCAGRFSAETEHAWLMGDDRADHFQSQRATFVSLLEATVDDHDRRQVLSYRIEVKLAHSALLTTASFAEDDERAATAHDLANAYLLSCGQLLLDG